MNSSGGTEKDKLKFGQDYGISIGQGSQDLVLYII